MPMKAGNTWDHMPRRSVKQRSLYLVIILILSLGLLTTAVLQFWPHSVENEDDYSRRGLDYHKEVVITADSPVAKARVQTCTFHTCFDVYHCGYNDDNRISIYVYPSTRYVDETGMPITLPISREFSEILQTVMDSIYYTNDLEKACLFLPPLDLLNQNNIRLTETSKILSTLPR